MSRFSKGNKCFILIILILVSLNSIQTIHYLMMGKTDNSIATCYNRDCEGSNYSERIKATDEYDYIISGETGSAKYPTTVCSSDNQIFILWQQSKFLKISEYNASLNRIAGPNIVINASSLVTDEFELSQPMMLIDSADNLHIFCYIMGFDTPQQGDIYYLKMNENLEVLVNPKVIHTYTHNGFGSSCFVSIFTKLFIDEMDTIHLLVEDNTYYLLNDIGEIENSIVVPEELGPVQDLVLDEEGNAIVLCGNDDDEFIYSIKYQIEGTNITEQDRNLLLNASDKIIYYTRMKNIGSDIYLYWHWENKTTYEEYNQAYLINSNGSLGESRFLNEHFFTSVTYNLNSTHAASLRFKYGHFAPAEIYYSLFKPTQNQSYTENKLLIRFLKPDEANMYYPIIFALRLIYSYDSQFILSWFVNDGTNHYQVFLWKCDLAGITTAPLVVVAPDTTTTPGQMIKLPELILIPLVLITNFVVRKILKRKK